MNKTRLTDGTEIYCLRKPEAKMLDHHVEGYLQHGITISDNDVIFDVGANIGVFGVRALRRAKNVSVYCFEPIPDIAEILSKNAQLHGHGRLKVLEYGVSDSEGTATFTYFPNTPALSTLHPEQWDNDPGAFTRAVKGTMKNPPDGMKWMRLIPPFMAGTIAHFLVKGKKQVNCKLVPLSDVISKEKVNKIDLLKIDCEGAEWSVLQGIKDEHWPMIGSMVIEVHDKEGRLDKVKELLTSKGFNFLHAEREKGLEDTAMYNLFARRV
jgi:FkbM family methyltransferase